MSKQKLLNQIRLRRQRRARAKIIGTALKPRLAVFRSNRYDYAQLIDDDKGETLVSVSSKNVKSGGNKLAVALLLGELIAKKALENNIKQAVFDRRDKKYHGRVKAVAEGARKGGLGF